MKQKIKKTVKHEEEEEFEALLKSNLSSEEIRKQIINQTIDGISKSIGIPLTATVDNNTITIKIDDLK